MLNYSFLHGKTVYVDVDGTLIHMGIFNKKLIDFIRENSSLNCAGGQVKFILWSAAGEQHCLDMANAAGIDHLFIAFLDKPHFVVDDYGVNWVKYCINLFRKFRPGDNYVKNRGK